MKSARQLCIAILIVIVIAAFSGGFMLIHDDTGRSLQLSIDDLKGSPFTDFGIIGWILIIAVGIFSAISATVTSLHRKSYPYFIITQGILLLLFVVLEYLLRKNLRIITDHTDHSVAAKHPQKKSHYHKHRKRGH